MAVPVVISGTDPTNPKCAAHIVERLEQIERDTRAMHEEAGRLMVFVEAIRDVLIGQGRSFSSAQRDAAASRDAIRGLRSKLDEASSAAKSASQIIFDSRVIMSARFDWRPTSGR
jgi:hypothetical protein